MGVPATQGRLCTKLEGMEIGDYIRCAYTANTAGVVGEFSDLGGADVTTAEIPTSYSSLGTVAGFFYFIKVDKGLLISDRLVQSSISWSSLNHDNYIHGASFGGNLIRIASREELKKYCGLSNLDGKVLPFDRNVWHQCVNNYNSDVNDRPYSALFEITQNNLADTSFIMYNFLNEANLTGGYGYQSKNATKYTNINVGYYYYYSFRPVCEYIDNKKSKMIYY